MRAIPGAQRCRRCEVVTPVDELTSARDVPHGGVRGGYCPSCTKWLRRIGNPYEFIKSIHGH